MLASSNLCAYNLPDLGSSDLKEYDAQTETALGREFSIVLHQYYDLVKDPIILSYVRRIGKKIVTETGEKRHFSFHVINNNEINAFAGPNGIIGIHTGLIKAAKSEDELASVIAHEIAHVTLKHLSRTYEYQKDMDVASIATLIAAILVGSQNPSAGFATYLGGMGLAIEHQLKNSRIHEAEADYIGIKYLQESGYNPHAMANFFNRLEKESQLYEHKIPEILQTHPITQGRLAKARYRADQLSKSKHKFKNKALRLIQIRLSALTNNNKNKYQQLQLTKDEQCYFNNLQTKNNINCLKTAIKNNPKERIYKIQLANLLAKTNPKESYNKFKYLSEIYPSDFSIIYFYSVALEKNGQIKDSITLLKEHTPKFFYQNILYSRLALLYANNKEISKSYYYEALASFNTGNIKKSIYLTKQAQKLELNKKTNFYTRLQRLNTKLVEIEKTQASGI